MAFSCAWKDLNQIEDIGTLVCFVLFCFFVFPVHWLKCAGLLKEVCVVFQLIYYHLQVLLAEGSGCCVSVDLLLLIGAVCCAVS